MLEMRMINEEKRERTKYLWDLVRKWYRLRRFMNQMDDITRMNHISAQSGIVGKEELLILKSNLKDQKNLSNIGMNCFTQYMSANYIFWEIMQGINQICHCLLIPYLISTENLGLASEQLQNLMIALITFNSFDILFNMTCEKIKE